jgi:2-oxoisovalerate dehydrogenase E1 component
MTDEVVGGQTFRLRRCYRYIKMERDVRAVELCEEIANFGGDVYSATKGLPDRFQTRVINTPMAEAGFTRMTGRGATLSGPMPIVESMFADFTLVAADQVFNHIGKARYMYGGGDVDIPLVARARITTA